MSTLDAGPGPESRSELNLSQPLPVGFRRCLLFILRLFMIACSECVLARGTHGPSPHSTPQLPSPLHTYSAKKVGWY